jgi:hypothetical protein
MPAPGVREEDPRRPACPDPRCRRVAVPPETAQRSGPMLQHQVPAMAEPATTAHDRSATASPSPLYVAIAVAIVIVILVIWATLR